MELLLFRNLRFKTMLLEAPCFPHESLDSVSVYRPADFLPGYGKTDFRDHRRIGWPGTVKINKTKGVNRKRLSGTEKRINLLFAF